MNHQRSSLQWDRDEEFAEMMIPIIGKLYRRQNVVTTFFGKNLVHKDPVSIMKIHREAVLRMKQGVTLDDVFEVLQVLSDLDFQGARIDIGKATSALHEQLSQCAKKTPGERRCLLRDQLLKMCEQQKADPKSNVMDQAVDVVLYGFGRIGRLMARLLIEKRGAGVKLLLRAIVVRKKRLPDLKKRADLLLRDSVHGPFHGTVEIDEERNCLIANGNTIQLIYSKGPDQVDYTKYGINNAVVIDNTGIWRDEEALGLHLKSPGVGQVLLTAPARGTVPNIVAGINHDLVDSIVKAGGRIFSAASCTTNAVVPILKVMDEAFGIQSGHIESVHSFTNDQNLIDNFHDKARRGRAATLNMVLTETGAAKAVVKVLPGMKNKLTASAIRVPTPNVSMAILILRLNKATTVDQVNQLFFKQAHEGQLMNQIDITDSDEVVSSDHVGNHHACIVDAKATIVDGTQCNLYVWYDNEFGYSCQVTRVLQKMAGIQFNDFPHVAGGIPKEE